MLGTRPRVTCANPVEGVIVLSNARTIDQETTLCAWFARAAAAVRSIIDETPGGAIVIHRCSLPVLISDEDHELPVTTFSKTRVKGLLLAFSHRQGLRAGLYDDGCTDVLVIFDPDRTSLERARDEVELDQAYAPEVRDVLPLLA